MSLKKKSFYTTLVFVFFLTGYFLIQRVVDAANLSLLVEVDKWIPLMTEFIWIYHSLPFYILIVMVFLIKRANVFWRTVVSCLASSVVMFACFVFLPVEYPRPDIVTTDFSSALLSFTQEVDFAHNTCPSGHVAFAWLMFLAAINTQWIKQEPWMGRVTLLWSIGIIMSTLVLKQHFIADVFAGVFLASFSFYCSKFVVPNKLTAS
jgi:membrane-associated phospholipid phosphatase